MLQRIYSANLCDRLDSDVSGRMTLSHRLNHFPPLTPFSRVANMRSVHIDVSTHFHFSDIWVSDFCLAISTISLRFFFSTSLCFAHLPSYPTSLRVGLLSTHLASDLCNLNSGLIGRILVTVLLGFCQLCCTRFASQ